MSQTLGILVETLCREYETKDFLFFPSTGKKYTYHVFYQKVLQIAQGLLSLGLKKGDFIAIKSLNRPEWIAIEWAAFKIGVVAVGLNANLTSYETEYAIGLTEAKILFTDDTSLNVKSTLACRTMGMDEKDYFCREVSKEAEEEINRCQMQVEANDPAIVLFTSGTTSKPKAVVLSHQGIVMALQDFNEQTTYSEDDNALVCAPFSHIMGTLYGVLCMALVGGKITLLERFKTQRVLESIENEKCSVFLGVPTMYQYILNEKEGHDLSSLRTGLIAGSCVSKELYERIYYEIGAKEIIQSFGQTEVLAISMTTMTDAFEKRATTTGRAIKRAELKIVDIYTKERLPCNQVGELMVRTPYAMIGYLKDEEATKNTVEDSGWIHTGDLAHIDEQGYLHIGARIKDIIIRCGENIAPAEIEAALLKLSEVKEAAVVGVSDSKAAEEICAFIVTDEKVVHNLDFSVIKEQLSRYLAKFKIPKYIITVSELPTTSSGKVKRHELKTIFSSLESTC